LNFKFRRRKHQRNTTTVLSIIDAIIIYANKPMEDKDNFPFLTNWYEASPEYDCGGCWDAYKDIQNVFQAPSKRQRAAGVKKGQPDLASTAGLAPFPDQSLERHRKEKGLR
jgi:hypothetical protein